MADNGKKFESLARLLGNDSVKSDTATTAGYSVDGVTPGAVAFPKEVEQVAELVALAGRENLALLPWGGGSKMAMGNPPKRLDVVVCTEKLNRIIDVDDANLTVTVQAGVKFWDAQNRFSRQENRCYLPLDDPFTESDRAICSTRDNIGCFVPFDPPDVDLTTFGGMIAANSNGPRRLLYGLPRDLILGVRFVAPNGEIIGAGGKTVKNVSGYDISKLIIGSAGTLGIVCEMTARLLPLPESLQTLVVSFDSLQKAGTFIDRIFASPLLPAAVELMNAEACSGLCPNDAGKYFVAVALEANEEAVKRMARDMLEMAKATGATGDLTLDEDKHHEFWRAVSNMGTARQKTVPDLVSLRLNYPLSAWMTIMEKCAENIAPLGVPYTTVAHAGNGVTLLDVLLDRHDDLLSKKTADVVANILTACREAGGNMVVLKSPGTMKSKLPVWGAAGTDYPAMKRIKEQMDPKGIMSPGRFIGGL